MATVPGACGGVTTDRVVSSITVGVMPAAAAPVGSKVTTVATVPGVQSDGRKSVPITRMVWPPVVRPLVGKVPVTEATANTDGTAAAGSVSARIIRRPAPNLMNLRLNIDSPLEVPLDAPFVRRLGRVEIRLGATVAPTN